MQEFFEHYGTALLATVTVIFCIYALFGWSSFGDDSSEKNTDGGARSINAAFNEMDQTYSVDEIGLTTKSEKAEDGTVTESVEDEAGIADATRAFAAEDAPTVSYENLTGLYTGEAYPVKDLFLSDDGAEKEKSLVSQITNVYYVVTPDTPVSVRRLIENSKNDYVNADGKRYYNGHDNTHLFMEGDKEMVDALAYFNDSGIHLAEIDENGTDKTVVDGNDYKDDKITFSYPGEYVVTVYCQGNKRVKRQFDVHVLKKPSWKAGTVLSPVITKSE